MNTKQTEALKLALEGLEKWHFDKDPRGAADYIAAIHDALAEQPAQPSKPWVGLTEDERADLRYEMDISPDAVIKATEAKLREKNS